MTDDIRHHIPDTTILFIGTKNGKTSAQTPAPSQPWRKQTNIR